MVTAESPPNRIGLINLDPKPAGKPIAGNRHDGFEEAGAGNRLMGPPKSAAPVLDPTRSCPRTGLRGCVAVWGQVSHQPDGSRVLSDCAVTRPLSSTHPPNTSGLPQRHPGAVLSAIQNVYTAQSSDAGGRAVGICRTTGGSIRRYVTSARTSSSSQFDAWSQIMPCQWSVRPSGVMPLRMARAICPSVHAPIPVPASLVMLRDHKVPKGRQLIFCPPAPFGL